VGYPSVQMYRADCCPWSLLVRLHKPRKIFQNENLTILTCTVTPGWLSLYVVNILLVRIGIRALRSTICVITPPAVSIPNDRGVTSTNSKSLTVLSWTPLNTAAWTAAP